VPRSVCGGGGSQGGSAIGDPSSTQKEKKAVRMWFSLMSCMQFLGQEDSFSRDAAIIMLGIRSGKLDYLVDSRVGGWSLSDYSAL